MNSDELEEAKKTNLLLGNLFSEVVQIKFELINERLRRERGGIRDLSSDYCPDSPKSVEIPVDLGTGGTYKIVTSIKNTNGADAD